MKNKIEADFMLIMGIYFVKVYFLNIWERHTLRDLASAEIIGQSMTFYT